MADLFSIGEHCSVHDCRQRDFLPFTCNCCKKVFCLEHRTYASHACPNARGEDAGSIICPLCARLVKIGSDGDANAAFERHSHQDCDPSHYAQVHRRKKCPVPGCKEKLSSVNTYNCKHCHLDVCLKHRLASDHQCPSTKEKSRHDNATSRLSRLLSNSLGASPSDTSTQSAETHRKADANLLTSASKLWSRLTETKNTSQAESRQDNATQARSQGRGSQNKLQAGMGAEVCPECGASFKTVDALIAHCQLHNLGEGSEVCPQCQACFHSVADLVNHVERQHPSQSTCVLT